MSAGSTVIVVGGGITGLTVAHELSLKDEIRVTLIEENSRTGGKMCTVDFAGERTEAGPDSFVLRGGALEELLSATGLLSETVRPSPLRGFMLVRGKLRPIPPGLMMGFPKGSLLPFLKGGILSVGGIMRASLDLFLPATDIGEDIALGKLVTYRFGRQFKENVIDTLVGGIMACTSDDISTKSVVPNVYNAAARSRSLMLGLRKAPTAAPQRVLSIQGGMQRISDAVLSSGRIALKKGERVEEISPAGSKWQVITSSGKMNAEAVVACIPAAETSKLIKSLPELSHELSKIESTSVGVILLAFEKGSVAYPPGCSGFLVSPSEGRLITGCTFVSQKWHLHGSAEIIRCFVGRPAETAWQQMGDEELISRTMEELSEIVHINGKCIEAKVIRWKDAFPRYAVGHVERVERIRAAAPPGLYLAGASYGGVGLSACAEDALKQTHALLSYLASKQQQEPRLQVPL
ncbi:MAG: protoporphyrinogen oxidase [Methanomassiliicoccales archaeon]